MTSMENNGKATFTTAVQDGESTANINLHQFAKSVKVFQSCAILINNHHTQLELTSPKRHLYSGWCELPPPPMIRPGFREVCLFRKIAGSGYGSSGVLSFDINKVYTEEGGNTTIVEKRVKDGTRLFLMWSVPCDGRWETCHAVGISKNKEPNDSLFNSMYYDNSDWFHRKTYNASLEYQYIAYEIPIRVLASISDGGNATWKIDIR